MPAKTEEKFVMVTESFAVDLPNGVPIVLNKGKVISAEEEVAKLYPQFFRTYSSRPVEQATAAPGEQRP